MCSTFHVYYRVYGLRKDIVSLADRACSATGFILEADNRFICRTLNRSTTYYVETKYRTWHVFSWDTYLANVNMKRTIVPISRKRTYGPGGAFALISGLWASGVPTRAHFRA